MRIPDSLVSLAECGAIDEVLRPLMSGKEAQIFLVTSGGKECIAKVYKEAERRAFRNRSEYTEGRRTRGSRDERAMGKRTRHGRQQDEAAWRTAEVDMIYRLTEAGVRVPRPIRFMDGVLVMELIADAEGEPAPRLGELDLEPAEAKAIYDRLVRDVVRMLCAGVVHGDLSDFNVLMAAEGPVLIDFPQAIDAARNPGARKMLVRDVDNLHRFLLRHAPNAKICRYAEEMWSLYETNELTPETALTGSWRPSLERADVALVLEHVDDAERDEHFRRQARGVPTGAPPKRRERGDAGGRPPKSHGTRPRPAAAPKPSAPTQPPADHRPPGARRGEAQRPASTAKDARPGVPASADGDATSTSRTPPRRSRRRRRSRR